MQGISRKTLAAVEAVLYIACSTLDRPIRSSEICKYQGLKLRYLESIMQVLVRDNILKGIRGPKGGYLLARDKSKILLSDIYDSVITLEENKDEISRSQLSKKIIKPLAAELEKNIREYLSKITIYELSINAKDQSIKLADSSGDNFDI